MLKVALVTSWGEKCGIAEYAKNLTEALKEKADYTVLSCRSNPRAVREMIYDCDVIHVNYEAGLFSGWEAKDFKSLNKPKVITWHTSFPGGNRNEITRSFSRVVLHERTEDEDDQFRYIPHGIYDRFEKSGAFRGRLGHAGFPFNWKGWDKVAVAGRMLNISSFFILPESRHVSAEWARRVIYDADPQAEVVTNWLEHGEAVARLAECEANVFPYLGGNGGISGAVRMAIAARRPVILSRCRQFRDLFDYEDEFYFIESNNPSPEDIVKVYEGMMEDYGKKKPDRILRDMGWTAVGEQYRRLYEEIV